MSTDVLADYGLKLTYILGILALGLAIILPLISLIFNPKTIVTPLIGILALGLVYFIGWSGAESTAFMDYNVNEEFSRVIGGALRSMYILAGIAIFGIIFSEVFKLFK